MSDPGKYDSTNLRFYADKFVEHKWDTKTISNSVFVQTLREVADRIEARQDELAEAQSFRTNYEHACQIERKDHQKALAEVRESHKVLETVNQMLLFQRDENAALLAEAQQARERAERHWAAERQHARNSDN